MAQVTGHKADTGWWDGPPRFEGVNRNMVSSIQREMAQNLLTAIFKGEHGLNIGGAGNYRDMFWGVNIDETGEVWGNAQDLPIKDGSISWCFSNHAMEHIKNVKKSIKECIRVLKLGGIIYCIVPDKRFFSHANEMEANDPYFAPSEMIAEEFKAIIEEVNAESSGKKIQELLFNSRDNNFDFDYLGKIIQA